MKICSDLHLNKWNDAKMIDRVFELFLAQSDDLLIIAGDLGSSIYFYDDDKHQEFFNLITQRFEQVIYVPGNHEWYGTTLNNHSLILDAIETYPRIKYLNNEVFEYNGFRYVGTTLWTDLAKHVKEFRQDGIANTPSTEDCRCILKNATNNPITVLDLETEYLRSITFLKDTIQEGDIVITHHLPSYTSINPHYVGSNTNHYFASHLDKMIEHKKPRAWIHGHTHNSCNYLIGNTIILCNPLGYPETVSPYYDLIDYVV